MSEDDPGFTVHDRRWWNQDSGAAPDQPASDEKPTYVQHLENQIADQRRRLAEAQELIRSASEEVTRARARIERDAQRDQQRWRAEFLRSFIDVLDDVDRALDATRGADPAVRAGLELIQRRFLARLAEHGVQRIDAIDEPFDPRRHDALSMVPAGSDQDGRVVGVIAPGYLIGDEILRPAQVAVGRAASRDASPR